MTKAGVASASLPETVAQLFKSAGSPTVQLDPPLVLGELRVPKVDEKHDPVLAAAVAHLVLPGVVKDEHLPLPPLAPLVARPDRA
eukprot:CAMPEP_0185531720 /NCGR_PEP_ID=MMETSP1366-20130426/107404_1 /TAXON_ID=38817 /ORGANISM="Gephyrocapsa oceanica, Strain RCC1303" /LENGTH=84 /DNA_ID=CAMNT_0028143447 /DNA_START=41 /DNA_END=292 /DNA_ORIENTATION=+